MNIVPRNDFQVTVVGLNKCRQALHPIAVVAVQDAVNFTNFKAMDVPAHNAIELAAMKYQHAPSNKEDPLEKSPVKMLQQILVRPYVSDSQLQNNSL